MGQIQIGDLDHIQSLSPEDVLHILDVSATLGTELDRKVTLQQFADYVKFLIEAPISLQDVVEVGFSSDRPIIYTEDLHSEYLDRSLVDKEYVDLEIISAINQATTTAANYTDSEILSLNNNLSLTISNLTTDVNLKDTIVNVNSKLNLLLDGLETNGIISNVQKLNIKSTIGI